MSNTPWSTAIAHRLQRPVVWIQSRREQLMSGTHGRGQTIKVRIGGDRDGRIRGAHIRDPRRRRGLSLHRLASAVPHQLVAQGLYDLDYLQARAVVAVTNKAPTGPYRGAGRPEAAIAIERAVDAFAAEIGMKPEDVRRQNYIPSAALPFTTKTGAIYDSGDYTGALELALETVDIESGGPNKTTGAGPAAIRSESESGRSSSARGGALGSGEYGKVELAAGRLDHGENRIDRSRAGPPNRLVADRGAASSRCRPTGSSSTPATPTRSPRASAPLAAGPPNSAGRPCTAPPSRSGASPAKLAAEMLESAELDLELVDGNFRVVGSPDSAISLAEVAAEAQPSGHRPLGRGDLQPPCSDLPLRCLHRGGGGRSRDR